MIKHHVYTLNHFVVHYIVASLDSCSNTCVCGFWCVSVHYFQQSTVTVWNNLNKYQCFFHSKET